MITFGFISIAYLLGNLLNSALITNLEGSSDIEKEMLDFSSFFILAFCG
jgi:hypothetical protein